MILQHKHMIIVGQLYICDLASLSSIIFLNLMGESEEKMQWEIRDIVDRIYYRSWLFKNVTLNFKFCTGI